MKKIILLAILSYFLLAPISYHPDTKLTLRYAALESGGVWDIYKYLNSHKLDIPDFHYPPAHYWWLKFHYSISKIIGGSRFDSWLTSSSTQASYNADVFKYNLAAKFPLLVLGILTGWLIYLIVLRNIKDERMARYAAVFWLFNPITLYSLVIMGQNDIVAIFLFVLGVYFYENWWCVLLWGLAAGVKSYPIIWAIMFLLAWEKNIRNLIVKIVSVLAVYGLILSPWITKSYFASSVLNSGLSQRMFIANIPIGFDKVLLLIPLLLVFIGLNAANGKTDNKMQTAVMAVFQSSLLILGFSHFNPQWMLWTISFISIYLGISKFDSKWVIPLLLIFFAWIGLTLGFDDRFLTWGLFSPVNPNLINFPTVVEFLHNKGISVTTIVNFCQSILAGVALWFIFVKSFTKSSSISIIRFDRKMVFLPWILVFVILFGLMNIFSLNRVSSGEVSKEVNLAEMNNNSFVYKIDSNLKYLEFSLNNSSLRSQDRGVITITDSQGIVVNKEFSGFNAGANGWIRVDIPTGFKGNSLNINLSQMTIVDGLTKLEVDNSNRWLVNFYYLEKPNVLIFLSKLFSVWWLWIIMLLVSRVYFKIKED